MNNFLNFYSQNSISPVSQKLDNLKLHFGNRIGLYRTLGLTGLLFEGRDVLEVAPGSGHNSIVTATLKSRSYDLIEPNPTGYMRMINLFEDHQLCVDSVRFFNTRLEDFPEKRTYDIVICEGLIPGLSDQEMFLRQLVSRVRKGGVLVVTCADAVSVFFESLRRYLAQLLTSRIAMDSGEPNRHQEVVRVLMLAFESHLNALRGMSRPAEDWIWDNLLNPAALSHPGKNEFSVERCLDLLGDEFYFYGSSPVFMCNWAWYKNQPITPREYNKAFLDSFISQRHNLLHYDESTLSNGANNESLYRYCKAFSLLVADRTTKDWLGIAAEDIEQDLDQVRHIQTIVNNCGLERSSSAIAEFLSLFHRGNIPGARAISEMRTFGGAFGRGQQYISLTRA